MNRKTCARSAAHDAVRAHGKCGASRVGSIMRGRMRPLRVQRFPGSLPCAFMKTNVLFVCIHNSARSQMAEAFLNRCCEDEFHAQSAGIEPGKLNPIVVEVMAEEGIDISRNATKSVGEMIASGQQFDYVITVCDETSAERCPIFPGGTTRLHWGFPDPSQFTGTHDEKLAATREVRDTIARSIADWCREQCTTTLP